MPIDIRIDKAGETPVYRQIVEQVTQLVQRGKLQPGDRLPPERALAEQLQAARGTVSKAYSRLAANNIITITHGRGTFVSEGQDVLPESRKDTAVKKMNRLIADLEKLRFSHQEIGTLFHLLLMEREERLTRFTIAAVDCNPEALAVFEEQLQHLSNVQIVKFLLDDVRAADGRPLQEYDLVLTTSTHYDELARAFPKLKPRLIQAAVSPSQQTVIDLAGIAPTAKVLIVCETPTFEQIIRNHLREFKIAAKNIRAVFESDDPDLAALLPDTTVMIIPPVSPLEQGRKSLNALRRFRERGGRIIHFTYQIERGTLIHIEERISELMEKE